MESSRYYKYYKSIVNTLAPVLSFFFNLYRTGGRHMTCIGRVLGYLQYKSTEESIVNPKEPCPD
jgi:hypothetical protein